jgi:hypothetical protein
MNEDFLDALENLYSPPEIVDKLNIDYETFFYLLGDYIADNKQVFEHELPEFFIDEEET